MPQVKQKTVGRPFTTGTRLARELNRRRLPVSFVSRHLAVSDRAVYTYLKRQRPVPLIGLLRLCEAMEIDRDSIVDRRRFLLPDERI